MSSSTNCGCSRASFKQNIVFNVLFLIFLLSEVQRTYSAPDYLSLHEQLSMREKVKKDSAKKAAKEVAPIIAETGHVFRFSLDRFTNVNKQDKAAKVHISELGEDGLPSWLSYNSHNNKLVGIPTKKDVRKFYLVLRSSVKDLMKTTKFEIEVREWKHQSFCRDGNPSLMAAAILNANIDDFMGKGRVKILRHFADYLDVEMHDLNMAERKSNGAFDPSIITAGPGDGLRGIKSQPGIVITWPVACGLGIPGDVTVNKLKHSSGKDLVYKRTGLSFVGWYVYKNQYRYRRQAPAGATPAATPTATIPVHKSVSSIISGTPVISPTPSVVIKTTIPVVKSTVVIIKPTPTPATRAPTTKPPKTEPETTKKLTTEMKTTPEVTKETTTKAEVTVPVTTMKPKKTTMKPEKTTMEPEKTTMEPKKTTMEPKKTTMKPEKTTMKPEKTTMEPKKTTMVPKKTTMKPKKTTMKPKKTYPIMTVKPDKKPKLENSIDLIELFPRQAYKLKIPRDLFEDDIDGDTYNLTLSLKEVDLQTLKDVDQSWIYLDTVAKYLYILPEIQHSGDNRFAIQATDSSGNQNNAVFYVKVKDDNNVYNNFFNVTVDADFKLFTSNAKNKVQLIEKIASGTEVAYQTLRTHNFYQGSVVINFACEALLSDNACNSIKAQAYGAKLDKSEFKNAMAPDFIVLGTSSRVASHCGGLDARKSPTGQTKNEYKWWEVVLIPVIVIAVLLLVIGLIFFFLYRRKRRYEPQKEDKNTFLYQKKPVIFREEYEEKPDVLSLEPLILPNEKAPLTNAAYQPRTSTPDGNASSSNSTEGDEKQLIEKSTPPQIPQPQSPPRSPPYGRSPPPYTEP